MYIRTTSLLALYIRNTRRYEHPSSATLGYRGGAMQTFMLTRTSPKRSSRKFALLGRCIESSMVPSFTGGSLGKEEKVETHLAQLD